MTFVIGLTGSIGMGKSTTAQMFADEGIPVWDADATVRDLYGPNGAASTVIASHYPTAMDGASVSRSKLRELIATDPEVLDQIQSLVHPLVAASRVDFLTTTSAPIVLLDIPLLFETGADDNCDAVVVVSVSSELQKARVLARSEMSEADLKIILSRQMPDKEKRDRARWVVQTRTLDEARQSVKDILAEIKRELANA